MGRYGIMSASEPTCLHGWRAVNWIMIVLPRLNVFMKCKGIYYYEETDKGRTAQAVHKRDQSDAACGIYMFFMACADGVSTQFYRMDDISYAGVVCGLGAWNSGDCGNRGILAA